MNTSELLNYPYMAQVEQCTGLSIVDSLGKGQFGIVYSTNDERLVIKLTLDKNEALIASRIAQIRGKGTSSKGLGPSHILPGIVFLFGIYTVPLYKNNEVYAIVREAVEPIDRYRLFQYKDLYPNIEKISDWLDDITSKAAAYHRSKKDECYFEDYSEYTSDKLEDYLSTVDILDRYSHNLSSTLIELSDNGIVMKDTHIGNIGISTINWGKYRKPGELVLFDLGFTPTNHDYEIAICAV